jgi:hypothetical protein
VTDTERRLRQLEAAIRERQPEPEPLDVDAVLAEWRLLQSESPAEPSPLPADIARLSDAAAIDRATVR